MSLAEITAVNTGVHGSVSGWVTFLLGTLVGMLVMAYLVHRK